MKRSLLLLLLITSISARAVTVSISVQTYPTCTYSNGVLQAIASGGVGPYDYQWNTGGTTFMISGLIAGIYSVTVTDFNGDQATDQLDLASIPYEELGFTDLFDIPGRCGSNEAIILGGSMIRGPPPYTVEGQVMIEMDNGGGLFYVWPFQAFENNYTYTFNFADGNGCVGTVVHQVGWPLEWPQITILDVQGTCAGAANGSITYQSGLEGHAQPTSVILRHNGQTILPQYVGGNQVWTGTYDGLAAGDYWLLQFTTLVPWEPGFECQDSVLVTVPDLGNTCGNVGGTAFMDYDANCVEGFAETRVPGTMLEILPGPYYTITDAQGNYSLNLPLGDYTIEQQSAQVDEHCTGTPIPFTLTDQDGLVDIDLPDTSLIPLDAQLTMASGPAHPGFKVRYWLEARNLTPAACGAITVQMTYDPLLSYVSASPTPSVVGNVVTWSFTSLNAFLERNVHVDLQVPPDITLLGTVLSASATLATTNTDGALANNSIITDVTVTGAVDPNQKVARTSTGWSDDLYVIDQDGYVDYTIRFQNTGSALASNVVVTDTIPQELDLGSLILGASSHDYEFAIREGRVMRFTFNNINLPDSNTNELLSHGALTFRIRPADPLLPGTVISNTANIFFDFNAPVITAPSVLTAEFSTGQEQGQEQGRLTIFPNPAADVLNVILPHEALQAVRLFAADGRVVDVPYERETGMLRLDVRSLPAGAYALRLISTNGEVQSTTFIKR